MWGSAHVSQLDYWCLPYCITFFSRSNKVLLYFYFSFVIRPAWACLVLKWKPKYVWLTPQLGVFRESKWKNWGIWRDFISFVKLSIYNTFFLKFHWNQTNTSLLGIHHIIFKLHNLFSVNIRSNTAMFSNQCAVVRDRHGKLFNFT